MDLAPFLPTIGVIVGALATIGGVAISARSNRKAEDKRLDLEVSREASRIRREDEAVEREASEAKLRKQTEIYEGVAQLFVGELSNFRAQLIANSELLDAPDSFDKWFKTQWTVNPDMRLRRVISGLTDDDHRLKITQICDAIMDYEAMALEGALMGHEQVPILLTLGFDLASAYARGQAIDSRLEQRWTEFRSQVDSVEVTRLMERDEKLDTMRRRAAAFVEKKKAAQEAAKSSNG